jgi:two-component system response regulator (stage 0 sporulation protein F)
MASILVVDDEPDVRLLIRVILEREGHDVKEAGDGAEALDLVQRVDPDVILLDIRMPGIDGWEVLEQLRESGRLSSTAVVMISAHSTPTVAQEAIDLGCRAFITKPFRAQDVTSTVQDVLTG